MQQERTLFVRFSIANIEGQDWESPQKVIQDIRRRGKVLTIEDERSIIGLHHAIWYYSFDGHSLVTWIVYMPYFALVFLGIGTSGVLGSTTRIVYDHVKGVTPLGESAFFSRPVLGFFMGVMVLAISNIVPSIFIRGETQINMIGTILIGFFAGIYTDSFYGGIKNFAIKFIKPSP